MVRFYCREGVISPIMEKKVKGEQYEEKETKTNANESDR